MKKFLLFMVLLAFSMPSAVLATTGFVNTHQSRPLVDFDFFLYPPSHKGFNWTCEKGDVLSGSFTALGDDLDFFVCDDSNYGLYQGGQNPTKVYSTNNANIQTTTWSVSWSVTVPEAGTWYTVYENRNSNFSIAYFQGSHSRTPAAIPVSPIQIQALGIALVIIVVALAFVFHWLNSPSKRPVQRVVFTQAPPTAPAPSRLCPSCGQAGLAPGTRFCPNCGQRLLDTDA